MQLYDSLTAIILPTVAFGLPLVILVLVGSLRDVSTELYDAMTVDGAGPFRILWQLVIPMSKGAIAAVGTYTALGAWNQFLFPLVLTQDPSMRVLTLSLTNYKQEFQINVPGMMMAVLMTALPVFVLYLVARRWLIAGLAGMGSK
jgi:xylobiose transport system permease protein